jgi:D-3-phosphoglycerate dehydrogenase / 2-oxoglutarate reductase
MASGTVLLPQDIAAEGKAYLRERGYTLVIGEPGQANDMDWLRARLAHADAVLIRTIRLTADLIAAAPNLKVVSRHGIGVDNVDVDVATARGIWVTFAPLSNAATVAEHTLGLMIAVSRRLPLCDRAVRAGDWAIRDRLRGVDLAGRMLGLLGLGRVGQAVAKRAALGMEMNVVGCDPYLPAHADLPPYIERLTDRNELFARADFLSLHVPATPETLGSIGASELARMKPTAYLINAARGGIVDEAALYDALTGGQLAGAALDVFTDEPPPKDHPLFTLDNVVLTPHNASMTEEATVRMAVHAAQGIHEVLSGQMPTWPVNALSGRSA